MYNQVAARSGSRMVFKRISSSSSSAASSSGDSNGYANAFNATSLLGLRRPTQPSPGIVPFPEMVRGIPTPRPGRQPYDLFGKSREERMARPQSSSSSSSSVASSNDMSPSMRNGYDTLSIYPINPPSQPTSLTCPHLIPFHHTL